jgi:hypothetical protein
VHVSPQEEQEMRNRKVHVGQKKMGKKLNVGCMAVFVLAIAIFGVVISSPNVQAEECGVYAKRVTGLTKIHANRSNPSVRTYLEAQNLNAAGYKVYETPKKPSIGILDIAATGHAIAVTKKEKKDDGKYKIIFSHSNFDLKGSVEKGIKAKYSKKKRTIKIETGYWAGKEFKVLGFIAPSK